MTEEFYFRSVSKHGNQKLRRIRAETFELAKEKAIEKFSHILYFKQKMDLQTALDRAAKASKLGKPYYITVEEDGECSIQTAPLGTVTHKFVGGIEDNNFKPKNNGVQATHVIVDEILELPPTSKKKKVAADKAPKKPIAKKISAKPSKVKVVKKASPKKSGPRKLYGMGLLLVAALKKQTLSMDQLIKKFKQNKATVSFHLSIARSNGFKIENTEKGYRIK